MFIYKITNSINGKVYIGMDSGSVSDSIRWREHQRIGAKADVEHRKLLYKAMVKYGLENFSYEVIEDNIKDYETLRERETFWIRESKSLWKGYNMQEGGGPPLLATLPPEEANRIRKARSKGSQTLNRMKWEGTTTDERKKLLMSWCQTTEAKQKRSDTLKDWWNTATDEERNHKARGLKNQWQNLSHDEKSQRTQRSNGLFTQKSYIATSPSGVVYNVDNLKSFCSDHNLSASGMGAVARGCYPKHKGWTCRFKEEENNQ